MVIFCLWLFQPSGCFDRSRRSADSLRSRDLARVSSRRVAGLHLALAVTVAVAAAPSQSLRRAAVNPPR